MKITITKASGEAQLFWNEKDFPVEVSKWIEGKENVRGTVGDAKMIDWFESVPGNDT